MVGFEVSGLILIASNDPPDLTFIEVGISVFWAS